LDLVALLDNPKNIVAMITALICFAAVFTLAAPMLNGDKLESRLKSVANRREELRRKSRALIRDGAQASAGLRRTDAGLAKKIVDGLQLTRLLEDANVVDKLAQAGYRGPKPVTTFYFFRLLTPFGFLLAAAFYLYGLHATTLAPTQRLAACVAAFVGGYYAPNLWIQNRAAKRLSSIIQVFPDALDLLLICVESGMSVEAALQKVGSEVGSSSIELAEELTLLTAELSYLPDRRTAYEGLAKRTNHPGVKGVVTALIQAERYGTPVGTALRVMAKENRDMRLAAAEKKAAQLPAKLTVPMIVFFLPVLFVVILGPAIIRVQDTFKPPAKTSEAQQKK
jgi:tight adherence protein C